MSGVEAKPAEAYPLHLNCGKVVEASLSPHEALRIHGEECGDHRCKPGWSPRERGILFSAPMVRALLAGAKTQTRRALKNQAVLIDGGGVPFTQRWDDDEQVNWRTDVRCPYGVPGDRLWARETHAKFAVGDKTGTAPQCVAYRATCDDHGGFDYVNNGDEIMHIKVTKWTPAIHMPRWASRITLEVTDVRVQRLWDISEEDARAEGLSCLSKDGGQTFKWGVPDRDGLPGQDDDGEHWQKWSLSARAAYARLWDSINGAGSWLSNPYVWAISFRRLP